MTPHSVASSALRGLINESDLDKYYDIYDIGKEDIEDAELGMKDLELEDPESIKTLKTLLHRLHNIRRVFLCFLLALDANGGYSDFATWRTVVQELKSLGSIMGELGQELRRIGDEEQRMLTPLIPANPRSRLNFYRQY